MDPFHYFCRKNFCKVAELKIRTFVNYLIHISSSPLEACIDLHSHQQSYHSSKFATWSPITCAHIFNVFANLVGE